MIGIKRATVTDVPALVKLINRSYRGDAAAKGWTTESHLLDGIRIDAETLTGYIQDKDTIILKCINNNELQGSVYINKKDSDIYFGMLTVDPDRQNTGIGKLLLKHVEWFAREQNCNRIYMTVITIREELIAWYERHGFKKTGEVNPFPEDTRFGIQKQPLELLVMEKYI
ncbi:GNAT family N-acetyltransferase [Mucilaginibacter sp. PPCGB 2223]|uniref:GNAT family N-acetyltransferase n=1 Tax=Mucilaginibacter sp. PPCGB 2223 TaxID=1886027 RepID=UPI00082441DF|nr:GNAT family N-acetyltransferase [Mucilaginibacter sp. PPCGB 2223]OCX54158.1 GNAT family N-acetyltransferase [Mucilaginibacter sp. PPCGB 2223]